MGLLYLLEPEHACTIQYNTGLAPAAEQRIKNKARVIIFRVVKSEFVFHVKYLPLVAMELFTLEYKITLQIVELPDFGQWVSRIEGELEHLFLPQLGGDLKFVLNYVRLHVV